MEASPCLDLRLGFLMKHLVVAGSGHPESSLSYIAIDLGSWGLPVTSVSFSLTMHLIIS